MAYQCPRGHQSTDSDYCSECGALIGQSRIAAEAVQASDSNKTSGGTNTRQEICPDCGTLRAQNARFCEVCRHDFQDNKTGVAEAIVASQRTTEPSNKKVGTVNQDKNDANQPQVQIDKVSDVTGTEEPVVSQKLNVVICVDRDKADSWDGQSPIKPDSRDRVFPLDLSENLVGRRSAAKGIYPEVEINDPGVSHRHLKFILQSDGGFSVLELGSSNGTELNGKVLEPGVTTPVKSGDELTIGIWTRLKIESR